jgi:SPP1 gp7 family putative phage head morphogenesis protein
MSFVFKARRDIPNPEDPLSALEQEVANIIRTHTADAETAAMSNAVRDALAARNVERVVDAFPWDATAQTINQTAETFGQVIGDNIGKGFPSVGFRGRFDYTDPRTIEWAKNQSAQLVTAVTDNMRNIIRTTVAESFTQGVTVRDTARKLSQFIGLNDRQAISFAKFESGIAEKIAAGTITEKQAAKMIDAQYKKMIKYRSQMIARHEIAVAEAHGRWLGYEQAIEQGWANPKSMKRWSASTDERTCEICGPMNGKSVLWNEPFPNGVYREPAHIMCRCTTTLLEPDSKLAQSFMPPAKIAPPIMDIPMPALPTVPVLNLRGPQEAVATAHGPLDNASAFQYDAGEIEGLNVVVESVMFNGSPHTELRFKLTQNAKTGLMQAANRSIAQGKQGAWSKTDDNLLLIDKKVGRNITFTPIDNVDMRRDNLFSTNYQSVAYKNSEMGSLTYTKYNPDGTAIRFVVSKDAYAFDGQVRVMIPGKATPAQIEAAMRELGITANRLPSAQDIENLKTGRIISLFTPKFGSTLTKTPDEIKKQIALITKNYGFTLDEVETYTDTDGVLRLLLPKKVAEDILKNAGVNSIHHSLGGFLYDIPEDEQVERLAALFSGKGKLYSTVQRRNRGIDTEGISSAEDIKTGGADYVFLRPSTKPVDTTEHWGGTIVFDPVELIRRGDWFAYHGDSYGIKNPLYLDRYLNSKTGSANLNYIDELTDPIARSEIMFPDNVEMKDMYSLVVADEDMKAKLLGKLNELGITTFNGRKVEDIIITRESR